ncbi:helix-turn-helix domain-containing protein [Halobacillus campisalis]|uniref:Helix-turn-helix domain-containing protein n=1 Tax=Halobacillus campisalis TaxID=435909 RepID=A0ABW2K869_9BACI|nr:helix-turn-helix transcriptional regulator [Halobacillus campisalis]
MNGELFRTVRKVNGLTQHEMAKRLRVSRSLVSKIEVDSRRVKPYIVTRLYIEFGEGNIAQIKRVISDQAK